MRVLGIETSCDETGVAVYDTIEGVVGHKLHSQIDVHRQYGGVVPEISSRDHVRRVLPLIEEALAETGCTLQELDGIAYTSGPGLVGSLMVGASVGRSLAFGLNIPSIAVHHMEGHLLAPLLEDDVPAFPFVALLVSGGHTQLIRVGGVGDYVLLGESVDDAAGEAFDKTARLLGLPYPGGPELAKLATKGERGRFRFPRPMVNRPGLDFSFSGLKTAVLNATQMVDLDEQTKADIAYAFQEAVVETLTIKCRRAMDETQLSRLVVAGGVSANLRLREQLKETMKKNAVHVYYPRHEFCTDNGAMIAFAGCKRLEQGLSSPLSIDVKARWPLTELGV